jgi:hypothetical protein
VRSSSGSVESRIFSLSVDDFSAGMYTVIISIDGKLIETKQLEVF